MLARILPIWLAILIPVSVNASLLDYNVDDTISGVSASLSASITLTHSTFGSLPLSPSGSLNIPLDGTITIDTGLPGNFNNGANGLQLNALTLSASAAPGLSLASVTGAGLFGGVVPVSVTGAIQAVSIVLDMPLSTPLTPSGNPGEYNWGPVNILTTVDVDASYEIKLSGTVVQSWASTLTEAGATIPVHGTFSGDGLGTQVVVVVDLTNYNYLSSGSTGVYSWDVDATASNIVADFTGTNPTPLPEPSAEMLQVVSLLGLGLLAAHRRRSRA